MYASAIDGRIHVPQEQGNLAKCGIVYIKLLRDDEASGVLCENCDNAEEQIVEPPVPSSRPIELAGLEVGMKLVRASGIYTIESLASAVGVPGLPTRIVFCDRGLTLTGNTGEVVRILEPNEE